MSAATPKNARTQPGGASRQRYLCVQLENEQYAIPILKVREIQAYAAPTAVPRMPDYVRGVVNLHGAIVPVIDLRLRLGLPAAPLGPTSVIVFLSVAARTLGLIVDAATRVLDIAAEDVGAAPDVGRGVDAAFISGLARSDRGLIVLLETDVLLGRDATLGERHAPGAGRPTSGT